MKQILIFMLVFTVVSDSPGQEIFERTFSNPSIQHVLISNFSGPITVTKSNDNNIGVTAVLENGIQLENVEIDFKATDKYLMVYLKTPCTKPKNSLQFDRQNPVQFNNWKSNCQWVEGDDQKLPTYRFTVSIPEGTNIYTSTIMDGDIEIVGISKEIWASNINGGIILESVVNVASAKTINGDIAVTYLKKPSIGSEFSTINGTINIDAPSDLSATTSFKSFTGSFFTDFSSTNLLPGVVKTTNKEHGFKYKVEDLKRVEINGGGTEMNFETFNGNVYLTENR